MLDLKIINGLVADGSGKPAFRAQVGIAGGKIVALAPQLDQPAARTIDAEGLVVAPGFIDVHNHSDSFLFVGCDCYNYLEQGVTTLVCGNCGESPAPYAQNLNWIRDEEERLRCARQAATPESFMELAQQASMGANVALFIGHGTIRRQVMDFDPAVPDEWQLGKMTDWVVQAMEAGYLGCSSGLIYAPSAYATTRELTALARAMAPYGGIYATHIRNEGDGVVAAVEEAIAIGREAGVQVQLSHLKVMGKHNAGTAQVLLEKLDRANRRGVGVWADQYPYEASAASLASRIPDRYHAGGWQQLEKRLADPALRRQMGREIFGTSGSQSGVCPIAAEDILISQIPGRPELTGQTLAQLAAGEDPMDTLARLLLSTGGKGRGIYFNQSMEDITAILASPWVFGGSDGSCYSQRRAPEQAGGHPRATGAFVRRLQMQRQLGLMGMEQAICQVTGAPARALGLKEQGFVQVGMDANLTVMNYETLEATGSYTRPCGENRGIEYVLVNGTLAVDKGRCLGKRAGKLLRRR